MKTLSYATLLGLLLAPCVSTATPPITQALATQHKTISDQAASQDHIDRLDDETRAMLADYRDLTRELDQQEAYNRQLARVVASEETDIAEIRRQVQELAVTRERILPLMSRMLEVLEGLVTLDVPFLLDERRRRLQDLREVMDAASTPLAEKYRRLLEAYRIEIEYAQGIEAYTGTLDEGDQAREVQFLRLGRTGLYYLTYDGQEAGCWDPDSRAWRVLDKAYRAGIAQGIRVARHQAAPDLIRLPIQAPEVAP